MGGSPTWPRCRASGEAVLTGPLCTGELSSHDPGERSDGSQGPHVQKWCCALCVGRERRALGLPDMPKPSSCQRSDSPPLTHKVGNPVSVCQLRTLAYSLLPSSDLLCDSNHICTNSGPWYGETGDKKALPVTCVLVERPFHPLTCREISSTSHSSSHSWATADMATTVEARMTTSPIWKEEAPDRASEQVLGSRVNERNGGRDGESRGGGGSKIEGRRKEMAWAEGQLGKEGGW